MSKEYHSFGADGKCVRCGIQHRCMGAMSQMVGAKEVERMRTEFGKAILVMHEERNATRRKLAAVVEYVRRSEAAVFYIDDIMRIVNR